MLVHVAYLSDMKDEEWMLWARMPFQFRFALGVSWTAGIWPRSTQAAV